MNLIETFSYLADFWHLFVTNQKRKYTGQPYTVHTTEVAGIYEAYFPKDKIGIAAAHGHDILEDTPATVDQLAVQAFDLMGDKFDKDEFGQVIHVIRELTDVYTSKDYPEANREQRKEAERNRLMFVRARAQNIKVADLISNTRDIVPHDPDFAVKYLEEKALLLGVLTKSEFRLRARAYSQMMTAQAILSLTPHIKVSIG